MDKNLALTLYKHPQTVFTLKEISLLFPEVPYPNLKRRVHYLIKTNKLIKIRRGIYAKEGYNPLELANKIFTPSYISFETVLAKEGLIFQYYKTIFAASYLSRKIATEDIDITYRKINDRILLNKKGVEEKDNYFIATKERAFLDMIFLFKNYYFDNLNPLDWEKIFELQEIYQSSALKKRVAEYHQISKNQH